MAWTYEQTFNSLTTADLNGQDSWSGDVKFDVSTTSPHEGAKCVECVHEVNSNITVDRSISGISSGTVYVSLKINRLTGGRRLSVYLMSGATEVARIFMQHDGTTLKAEMLTDDGAGWIVLATGMTNNTWYRFGFDFDDATQNNKYRCNVNNGSWSAWYGYYLTPSWTTIDKIRLEDGGNNGSGTGTCYFDSISPNYTISSASVVPSMATLGVGA